MFSKILIANRGEIACRVIDTCKRLGVKTVVVYSDADAGSLAVERADESVHIGGSPASESYLVMDKIIDAVKATGAEAIHPGFGFLSENPEFARRLQKENIAFIGPNPESIEAMGDKITSKKFAAEAGVSTVPGHMGLIENADEAAKIAAEIGYPVMIKASAGGGGKGMRIAWSEEEAKEGYGSAKAEAQSSFGDDRIFIEKFVTDPRHIEIQVLGDKHGNCIHLNERECSIQRRNQKVIEEAPSPFLDEATREAMGAQAIALSKAVNYDSAGTVEFIVDGDKNFYFLEMNTRLQVEHPVTEMTTGVDLVEQMLRVAYGEKLALQQSDISINGWAIEARVYAEDPYRGFLPSIGRLKRFKAPKEGPLGKGTVRMDSGVREGDEISMFYDPMIAKLVTHGPTRQDAIDVQAEALDRFHIEGIQDNMPFVSTVLDQERFTSGRLTTGYIAEEFPDGFSPVEPTAGQALQLITVAAHIHQLLQKRNTSLSGQLSQTPRPVKTDWVVLTGKQETPIEIDLQGTTSHIQIGDKGHTLQSDWVPGQGLFEGQLDGVDIALSVEFSSTGMTLHHRGVSKSMRVVHAKEAALIAKLPEKERPDLSKLILSPMPGLMISVDVATGDEVKEGQAVAVIEAMKMQNILRAEGDGVVKAINCEAGDSVAADEILIELE